ncbi:MAG: TonB-dependent receptor [Chlorobi bacterium]|nr:TonB-dependent receptor [Chlorobiota bacterium]
MRAVFSCADKAYGAQYRLLLMFQICLTVFQTEEMRGYLIFIGIAMTAISVAAQSIFSGVPKKPSAARDTLQYNATAVTVVATRQPEYNLEVPLATTVVPREQFSLNRNYGLDEALSLVPGALVQSRTGNHDVRVLIRGFGARGAGERSNAGTSRGVRFYVDGFPETEPDGRTAFDLIDLGSTQSIEVLRSNASALWGNAAGGVITLSTAPPLGSRYASAELSHGSFGFLRSALRVATPLGTEGVAYANVTNTSFDGWREHSQSSNFQLTAGAVTQLAQRTRLGMFVVGASNTFRIPGPLTETEFQTNPQRAQDDPAVYSPTYVARDERRSNRLGRIGVRLEQGVGAGELMVQLFAQPKFLQRSERNTFRDFTRYHVGGSATYSLTSQLRDGVHNHLLVGADEQYQDGAILFYRYDLATGGRGPLQTNKREGAENTGVFIQDELTIDAWSFVVGLRQDWLSYYYGDFLNPRLNDRRTFAQLSPKIGVTYRLSEMASVYINYGRGIEIPAGNETDPPSVFGEDTVRAINPLLDAIRSETYEVGTKHVILLSSSAVRAISYDVAAYFIRTWNDLVPYRGGRFYLPAGRTERFGLELGVRGDFAEGISVFGMLTLMRTRLAEYVIDSVYTQATYNPALEGKKADLSGNTMPGVPDLFTTVRVQWQPQWFDRLRLEMEMRHVGRYYADDRNRYHVPAYTIFDAGVQYRQPLVSGTTLIADIRCNNLSDARYIASVWINPDITSAGAAYIEPGLPRNVMVRITVQQQW